MQLIIRHDRCLLFNGDAGALPLPEASVDAIVTDPPAGIGFMGKGWDSDKGGRDHWIAWLANELKAAFRALKPGGHALVWALPRTSHWTATALENLGFEIRDVHMHIFGTGFPKSLDVSKAIDAKLGKERAVTGTAARPAMATAASGYEDNAAWSGERRDTPATTQAERWQGWGTALKPAAEHWILCRKPLAGTVAENVMAHGTGGLNIDATRIGTSKNVPSSGRTQPREDGWGMNGDESSSGFNPNVGRWPAHVSFDEDAAAVLDGQSGVRTSGKKQGGNYARDTGVHEGGQRADGTACYGDSGGASRFFYVTKPSRSEKEAGLKHLPQRTAGEATDREEDSAGLSNPRAGAGRTGGTKREKLEAEISWEGGAQKVELLVDTATSPPRVTAASGAPSSIVSAWNTMLFGNERTALSLRVTTSTTETKTSSITGSKILKWYRGSSTSGTTADASSSAESGSSPAEDAACFSLSRAITSEQTESLLGVSRAPSQCNLRVIGRGERVADGIRNHHCTVKSIALMRWLVRLITPPGGIVLDPFAGSGTTGVAALAEGASFVGVEQNPEYIPITQGRLEHALKGASDAE